MKKNIFSTRLILLLLVFLGIFAYFNTFQNQFLWDDDFLIVKNDCIKFWNHWWHHFALDLYHSYSNYYRPMQMLTYNIDYSLWKLNPFGYHLTNLLLHILVAILLFFFIRRLTKDKRIAFVATAIFVVHPLNIESVTYIAGRADSLMAAFLLGSILFFDAHFDKKGWRAALFYYFSVLSFVAALLSKEAAIVFPLIIFIYALFFKTGKEIENSKKCIGFHYMSLFLVVVGVYAILRMYALNFLNEPIVKSDYSIYLNILTGLKVIVGYIGLVFFPFKLYMERSIVTVGSIFEIQVLASLALIIILAGFAVRSFKLNKVVAFSIIWFFLNLLPVSGIFPLKANMSEHWMYVAIMGFLIFLAVYIVKLWDRAGKGRVLIGLIFIIVIGLFIGRTLIRNADWSDKTKFYENTLHFSPNSVKVLNNLANLLMDKEDYDAAMRMYRKAILIQPKDYRSHLNIGVCYMRIKEYDKALVELKKSVELSPDFPKGRYNLAMLYEKKGDPDSAIKEYKAALENNPFYIEAYNNLGNIYFDRGEYFLAERCFLKVIEFDRSVAGAYNNLGNIYIRNNKADLAIKMYKEAVKLDDKNADFYLNLGVAYGYTKEYLKAQNAFQKAISAKPRLVDAHINMGLCYYWFNKKPDAKKEFEIAIFLDPENKLAKEYLEKCL